MAVREALSRGIQTGERARVAAARIMGKTRAPATELGALAWMPFAHMILRALRRPRRVRDSLRKCANSNARA